jgi:hypothetical protein
VQEMTMAENPDLDRNAAITRSLLGWGSVAGPFYVVFGLVLAVTTPGFDITRHALSLLTLSDLGWLQRTNLILTGIMAVVAALGILRAIRNGRGLAMGVLVVVYGAGLVLSAVFVPDPVAGFPAGSTGGDFSLSGILHLFFGALGFFAIAVAAFADAAWSRTIGSRRRSTVSIVLGLLVIVGFVGGAALSAQPIGVLLLWIAVLAQFIWLGLASAQIYVWSPHPLRSQR